MTAVVGDGMKILCENSILQGAIPSKGLKVWETDPLRVKGCTLYIQWTLELSMFISTVQPPTLSLGLKAGNGS